MWRRAGGTGWRGGEVEMRRRWVKVEMLDGTGCMDGWEVMVLLVDGWHWLAHHHTGLAVAVAGGGEGGWGREMAAGD